MSDVVIYGDDCAFEILVADLWYEIMCRSEMTFKIQQEVILKTGINSGIFREKTTRLSEAFASVTGITSLDSGTTVSWFYITQESIRTQEQTIRLRFVDQAGDEKQISGTAIIVNCEINANLGDFAIGSVDFEFSGGVTIEAVSASPSGITIYSDTWDTVAGQNYISGLSTGWRDGTQYSLVGKEILEVDRSGTQHDYIGEDQTPGNRQCSWNTSTNRLVFEYDFEAGETVFVIFR